MCKTNKILSMRASESVEEMSINIDTLDSREAIGAVFEEYETYEDLTLFLETVFGVNLEEVIKYTILIYSEDSLLNTRPPMPLEERQIRAMGLIGIEMKDGEVPAILRTHLLNLDNRQVFEFVFEYLTKQKKFVWQEIMTLETQILENQRLRLRPVNEESGKDELMAFEKKGKMTIMYKEWYQSLKEMYDEFYGDNDNVRAIHRINRSNMATLENIAF